ncbi:MAG: DNA alkylation repair protein [Gammaproteobacteria bacterium]|nr:DNA alkylation repair protein [Gammaproteobacteria bacterium]
MGGPLKDIYTLQLLRNVGEALRRQKNEVDVDVFVKTVVSDPWELLEIKERMKKIAVTLRAHLPDGFQQAIEILIPVSQQFSGFEYMFFPYYVELFGEHEWDAAISALERFTSGSSSEFAIRPFIIRDQKSAMAQMKKWSKSDDFHVRRLSSEGCRPRLPWAQTLPSLIENPDPIFPILDELISDEEEYVRRSVANNMNDISKDHPGLIVNYAESWYGRNKEIDWVVKHGCRTLLKSGNAKILGLFGFDTNPKVTLEKLELNEKVIRKGGVLKFSFDISADKGFLGKLRIEYVIGFQKKNGGISDKVFKLVEGNYKSVRRSFSKEHSFHEITTRVYHLGRHLVKIVVNGEVLASEEFELAA